MTKPLQDVLSSGDFGFADSSESLEDLVPLDDLFTPRAAEEAAPSMHAIRPDGLVAGSCGPLSRSPEHLVGYGFLAPEGNRQGRWQFSPQDCFRATKIYAWAWKGETALISSLLFGSDEQLAGDHPLPADLFSSWVSPKQFLEIYGGVDDPVAGQHRVLCKHLPGQPCFAVTLDFPTLSLGGEFEVAWTGPLHAFFVCGRELLPQRQEQAARSKEQAPDPDPDPDPPPGLNLEPCSLQPPAATKDTTV